MTDAGWIEPHWIVRAIRTAAEKRARREQILAWRRLHWTERKKLRAMLEAA